MQAKSAFPCSTSGSWWDVKPSRACGQRSSPGSRPKPERRFQRTDGVDHEQNRLYIRPDRADWFNSAGVFAKTTLIARLFTSSMGDSSTVEQRTLTPLI